MHMKEILMKKICCLFLFMLFASLGITQDRPEWDNIAIFKVNVEKPHASMMIYPSSELALAGNRLQSPWFRSLNGEWKFKKVATEFKFVAPYHEGWFEKAK